MLLETCANEFESYIKGLFKNPRMLTKTLAEVPVVGGVFIPDLMDHTPFLRKSAGHCVPASGSARMHQNGLSCRCTSRILKRRWRMTTTVGSIS